jgi:hypothetical protein
MTTTPESTLQPAHLGDDARVDAVVDARDAREERRLERLDVLDEELDVAAPEADRAARVEDELLGRAAAGAEGWEGWRAMSAGEG